MQRECCRLQATLLHGRALMRENQGLKGKLGKCKQPCCHAEARAELYQKWQRRVVQPRSHTLYQDGAMPRTEMG